MKMLNSSIAIKLISSIEAVRTTKILLLIMSIILFSNCSQYKSSWSCKNPEGIGCSSITYADRIARKHIILNDERKTQAKKMTQKNQLKKSNKVLIKEHYSDFEKFDTREVEIDGP